ncbi:hypothetical protein CMUS01_04367 [Colletotrichum musicola]|uniref:Cyanovirin-N domain-containing protein n=1 Tax=Colletotrichum musicola TaxID=2175873 RepID=A0A8H6KWV5_9PEZI|nr:hypothetical protein CMUS01_04367 [Colletotrichum musicola]
MRLLRILLLVVAWCSPPALGYCFRGGIKGNYAANKRIVNLDVVCGYLAGEYRNGEFKQMCMTDDEGKRWDFKLMFDRKDAGENEVRSIDVKECVGGMELQAKCQHGGTKAYLNWGYL